MNPVKPINDFAKQLLAWSAIAMVFLQPLGFRGNNCGCGSVKVQLAATAACCSKETSQKSCCSTGEVKATPCKCGDDCRCSVDKPVKPLPAVPVNEAQNDQSQTLAITNNVGPLTVSWTESKFGCQTLSVVQFALTAQQTCALLSRFIV